MMKLVPMATEPDRESARPMYLSSTIVASSDAHASMWNKVGCGWCGDGAGRKKAGKSAWRRCGRRTLVAVWLCHVRPASSNVQYQSRQIRRPKLKQFNCI